MEDVSDALVSRANSRTDHFSKVGRDLSVFLDSPTKLVGLLG